MWPQFQCFHTLDPVGPICKMEKVICMTPALGEEHRGKKQSLKMIFSLLISTPSSTNPQLWSPRKVVREVPRLAGQQGMGMFSLRPFTNPQVKLLSLPSPI